MPPVPALRARGLRLARVLYCAALVLILGADRAEAFRLVSWNVLNYPTAEGNAREDDMRAVLGAIGPDIVVCQEIVGTTGANAFRSDVLEGIEPGQWSRASFTTSNDTERALYYRTTAFTEIAHGQLPSWPRTVDWWRLRPTGYASTGADLLVYTVHLKASQGPDNEDDRNASAVTIRNHLNTQPAGTHFLVCGDLNIYTSSEPAWATLTGIAASNEGRVFDPINRVGTWHNNSGFADVHTQSTRIGNESDGGSSGGCDDRFDFILANDDLLDNEGLALLSATYETFGQDGSHYNSSINAAPTNAAVGQALANNLYAASDHLPVFVDFQLPARALVTADLDFGLVLQGTLDATRLLTIENDAQAGSDELDVLLAISSPFTLSQEQLSLVPGGNAQPLLTLDASALGEVSTALLVSTDAPDFGQQFFTASATVVRPSSPSLDEALTVTASQVDFGSHALGEFVDQTFSVFNLGYGSDQAGLEVFDAELDGPDAARFQVVGFSPTVVLGTPLGVQVAFDDAGAVEGTTYTATLTLSTQDDANVVGAAPRAGLLVELEATIENTGTAVAGPRILRTRLLPNVPNPFNPRTQIRFELRREGPVRVTLYSAQGRLVRTLVEEVLEPGTYERTWDGRSDDGRAVASGIYFVRMESEAGVHVRRAVLVR